MYSEQFHNVPKYNLFLGCHSDGSKLSHTSISLEYNKYVRKHLKFGDTTWLKVKLNTTHEMSWKTLHSVFRAYCTSVVWFKSYIYTACQNILNSDVLMVTKPYIPM